MWQFLVHMVHIFSSMKIVVFWLKYHWNMFPWVKLTKALVQIMAWHRQDDKPSSEPMRVSLLMHTCITGPQRVDYTNPEWQRSTFVNAILADALESHGSKPQTTSIFMYFRHSSMITWQHNNLFTNESLQVKSQTITHKVSLNEAIAWDSHGNPANGRQWMTHWNAREIIAMKNRRWWVAKR